MALTLFPLPRRYPAGLGDKIHEAYQAALAGPAIPDLRVGVAVDFDKTDVQLFEEQPVGDLWLDADAPSVFEYLYRCKHVRTGR